MSAESQRLDESRTANAPWHRWGPYLSERQWGTVREDYSEGGNAWNYFTHDQARSRAYHWGEDGLAGISDESQRICFALALWNGRDAILKERLFGLTNSEGNHGEDVKEYYFYLDSTPTHSYMKYLYKYPYAYPYPDLVDTNRQRGRLEMEYELLDTGAFDDDRYFDVFVEYAKESPEDILIEITAWNRGPETATLHLLPTLWFRNRWSWDEEDDVVRPELKRLRAGPSAIVEATEQKLGTRYLHCEGTPTLLFTENETNHQRIFQQPNPTPYVKDAFHEYLIAGRSEAVNPALVGTKCAAHYRLEIEPGASRVIRLRLTDQAPGAGGENGSAAKGTAADGTATNGSASNGTATNAAAGAAFPNPAHTPLGAAFDETMTLRRSEADEFYAAVTPGSFTADEANVFRQALAGMLWSKQVYRYDVHRWLSQRGSDPFDPARRPSPRNGDWHHMYNDAIISMPDKWEYPWYAAWDLAFHVTALSLVDPVFAKQQLGLMLRDDFLHPNGQIPAYEWNFGDVNPPVHASATLFTYRLDKARGEEDRDWLKSVFQKLLLNFTWWVNRKDRAGKNVFEGGFLGLDNIGVFDRSAPLPTGGYLEQADGTAWMGMYCLNMLEISAELAAHDPAYVDMCMKFAQHYLWIASAMLHAGDDTGMWDEEDGFFYDVLRTPDGGARRLKVRSMVGLLPLAAVAMFDGNLIRQYPEAGKRLRWFLDARPELTAFIHDPRVKGHEGRTLASILNETRLRRVLEKMLDENEFLGPHGIRSLSRYHADHPFVMNVNGREYRVNYLPAESDTGMFGGNSNWRGPVWMPVNMLMISSLLKYYGYYGDRFQIECPTGSGRMMNLYQVAEEITRRLANSFLRDSQGRRPVYGGSEKFQTDPHWRDLVLFYEYFHGDNGAGLGASHQTGWTGVIARLMHFFATLSPAECLAGGKGAYARAVAEAHQTTPAPV
jgi:hypothetical protein